mgnify:CR=1 FL=1
MSCKLLVDVTLRVYSTHPWVPHFGSCIKHTFKYVPDEFVAMTVLILGVVVVVFVPVYEFLDAFH